MENYDFSQFRLDRIRFERIGDENFCTIAQGGAVCTYPLPPSRFVPKAKAILMDLDGTSVKSEEFWIYLIEKTVKRLIGKPDFSLSDEDIPFVSGFSTIAHLTYCIRRYDLSATVAEANTLYHEIAEEELAEIRAGRGNVSAFKPREGLKDFLLSLKAKGVKIGLITSGLDYKAIPEILSCFRLLKLGDPLSFYDAIITGGSRKTPGQYGTIGELAAKPHPWPYAEIGMGLGISDPSAAVTLEDSSSGVISSRLAGYSVIGLNDGNIPKSGVKPLCYDMVDRLDQLEKYF